MSARWAKRSDKNQPDIVRKLRKLLGVQVRTGHDDLLIGYNMQNYWFEIKTEEAKSKKTGRILNSKIKPSQHKEKRMWTGQYNIVTTLEEILDIIGYGKRK